MGTLQVYGIFFKRETNQATTRNTMKTKHKQYVTKHNNYQSTYTHSMVNKPKHTTTTSQNPQQVKTKTSQNTQQQQSQNTQQIKTTRSQNTQQQQAKTHNNNKPKYTTASKRHASTTKTQ